MERQICISCDKKDNNLITYNTLLYCKNCYDEMLNVMLQYEKKMENSRVKYYDPPVQILDNLYIGNINSVNNTELKKLEINNIIIAGKRLRNNHHESFDYIELLIDDSLEQEIISFVNISNNFIDSFKNNKIMIHCYSGISRSGTILIGYIMHKFNYSYDEALNFVKNKYSKVHPNSNFENQLKNMNKNNNNNNNKSESN